MNTYYIVGAFYRPPAKVLLDFLAVGVAMRLIPDDQNEHDVNAMAVILPQAGLPVPSERLLEALTGHGIDGERYAEFEDVHVGYIPREVAAAFAAKGARREYSCRFTVSATGKPMIRIEET